MGSAIALVFVDVPGLALAAGAALATFLALGWRHFSLGTWVPVLLSIAALAVAVERGVPSRVLVAGMERALFVASLIAVLGLLRSTASLAPEVTMAGRFLTGQPPARRYVAMTLGGHLFGVLINFGGLAILLDLAKRSTDADASAALPPAIREVRLKRMTLAIVRGFALISLWSPLGFGANVVLLTLPELTYGQFGPAGFAMAVVFTGVGWAFDAAEGRRFRGQAPARDPVPPGAWRGAAALVGHVAALGGSVIGLHEVAPLSFQESLITIVPLYALAWSAMGGRGPRGIAGTVRATWARLSDTAGEVGVFAAAGFLSVVLLAIVPVEGLRAAVEALGLGAPAIAVGLSLSMVVLALLGVNPIVTASVLGGLASRMAVPGLEDATVALALVGGWTAVIGLSPFITTIILTSRIVGRSEWRIGPVWNGPYCLTILAIWCALVAWLAS